MWAKADIIILGLQHRSSPFLDCSKDHMIACVLALPGVRSLVSAFWPFNSKLNIQSSKLGSCGAVAQLGARVNGIHEVAGSIPASSTKPALLVKSLARGVIRSDSSPSLPFLAFAYT